MSDDNHFLTLAHANEILDVALATAQQENMSPMTVVVLDAGGHVVAAKRQDGSGILRFEVAFGKAWGALGMGRPSRAFDQVAAQRPHFVAALTAASQGRLIPVGGGVLIYNLGKRIIGAVGVSGDSSANDEVCAIRGILAAGLIPDPAAV